MTLSPRTQFWSEIKDLDAHIPEGKLEYLREKLRNDLFDFVLRKFLEHQAARGLSKADLARRLGRDPAQLNRMLGAPGNWTLATVSDLLVGIAGESLVLDSTKVPGTSLRNLSPNGLLSSDSRMPMEITNRSSVGTGSKPTITATLSS